MQAQAPLPEEPSIDIVDESFIAVDRAIVAREVARRWPQWWPGLRLEIYMDRGLEGMRWTVAGEFVGSSEVWLEVPRPRGDRPLLPTGRTDGSRE